MYGCTRISHYRATACERFDDADAASFFRAGVHEQVEPVVEGPQIAQVAHVYETLAEQFASESQKFRRVLFITLHRTTRDDYAQVGKREFRGSLEQMFELLPRPQGASHADTQ